MFEIADKLESLSYNLEEAISLLQILHEFCFEEGVNCTEEKFAMALFGERMVKRVALLGCSITLFNEGKEQIDHLVRELYDLSKQQKETAQCNTSDISVLFSKLPPEQQDRFIEAIRTLVA